MHSIICKDRKKVVILRSEVIYIYMAKILVIDDERAIRNTLKDILEFEGHEVDVAEDGKIGYEKARN